VSVVSVLGASGTTGRLLASALVAGGQPIVACGRDPERVRAAVAPLGQLVRDVRYLDVHAPDTVTAALRDTERCYSAIGPYELLGRTVVDAALAAGTDLVDVAGEQRYLRWVHDERHEAASRAGVRLLPGAGVTGAIGTLLADVAVSAAGHDAELHVAYTTAGGRAGGSWTTGTRRSIATMLGHAWWGYEDGDLVEERLGERRRLAWFPRPVGPMHAAAVPGLEAIAVPRRHPDVRAVHTYLAMPTWQAELLQAVGNASRREGVRRRLAGWLDRPRRAPTEEQRAAVRWACIAEARGQDGLARAWAYGRDPYATAAAIAVARGRALHDAPAGVVGAAGTEEPGEVLDALSVRCGLRWSVVRPRSEDAAG
jgi:short subunit dehydrogenase-like uncharacterized protein